MANQKGPRVLIPKFNLVRAAHTRDKLEIVFMDYVGTEVTGESFIDMVERVHAKLPNGTDPLVVRDSLLTLVGNNFTPKDAVDVAWRLSGNLGTLKAGRPVPPWTSQQQPEWVPVQVLEVFPGKNHWGTWGAYARLLVMAGLSCPAILDDFWSNREAAFRATSLGFTSRFARPRGPRFVYHNQTELTGFRFLALIEAKHCRGGRPGYEDWYGENQTLLKWNHALLMARAHIDPPCPREYTHKCWQCPVGYDQCFAGCHPTTWEAGKCPTCNKEDVWIDPSHPRRICIPCMELGR